MKAAHSKSQGVTMPLCFSESYQINIFCYLFDRRHEPFEEWLYSNPGLKERLMKRKNFAALLRVEVLELPSVPYFNFLSLT